MKLSFSTHQAKNGSWVIQSHLSLLDELSSEELKLLMQFDDQPQGISGLALSSTYVYWTNILAGTANDALTINPIGPFANATSLGSPQDIQAVTPH